MSPTIQQCVEHARQCEWYAARANEEEDRKFLLMSAKQWTNAAQVPAFWGGGDGLASAAARTNDEGDDQDNRWTGLYSDRDIASPLQTKAGVTPRGYAGNIRRSGW